MTTPRPQRSVLPVLFLTVFIDLVGFSIIFPLYPAMLDYYFGIEGSESLFGRLLETLSAAAGGEGQSREFYTQALFGGILGSLYSILQFFCAPLWGRLSDRVGRKPVLLLTIGGLAASYLLWFFSGSFLLLIISRLLGGVMGGNISVATAAVADATEESGRARGMGIIGAAFGLGFILGPAMGGALSYVDLSKPLAGVPGVNPFSAAAGGAFLLSLWNLLWVASRLPETLSKEARGKARAEARPVNPLKVFRKIDLPGVNRVFLVYFIFLLAFSGMEFTLPFLARDRLSLDRGGITLMFVYVGMLIALVQGGLVRRIVPRFGERNVALAGLALILPGLVATGLATSLPTLYAGLFFLAVGSALSMPSMTALASILTPPHRQGEILGLFRSLGSLSRAVAPALACAVYWKFGPSWPYLGGLVPVGLALLLGTGLADPRHRGASAVAEETPQALA